MAPRRGNLCRAWAQFTSAYGSLRCAAAIIGTADLAKYGAEVGPLLVACAGRQSQLSRHPLQCRARCQAEEQLP